MNSWVRPTLAGRMVLAMVFAMGAIWLLLVGFEYAKDNNEASIRAGMGAFMRYQMTAFEDIRDQSGAYLFAVSLEREFNRSRREDGRPDVLMELSDHSGQRPLQMTAQPLPGSPGVVLHWRHDARNYLVFRGDTALWTFQIAYPLLSFGDAITYAGSIVGLRLLMAFPILLLLIYLTVAGGLRPLRRLSDLVAARHGDDLSPLGFDARYGELQPVVRAIDGLLLQLQQKVIREHAFVQDAAHELRTPIAVISAHVHVLAVANTDLERRAAERDLERAIARSCHLIEQLLEIARLDGAPVPTTGAVDLAHVARQTLGEMVHAALERDIELTLHAPDSLPFVLELSPFKSILDNLINNAIRYSDRGGRIVIELARENDTLFLTVADNGPGIPDHERALVFERFYRGHAQDAVGSGLGLAIVRQAVSRLGGQVQIATGLDGTGCRFVVQIPGN